MNEPAFVNPLGDRFHMVDDLAMRHWLGVLSDRESGQDRVNLALRRTYEFLWRDVYTFLLRREEHIKEVLTPMTDIVGPADATIQMPVLFNGGIERHITVVNILSAGMVPSEVVRDRLLEVHAKGRVHMDHVGAERETDAEGHITGTRLATFKSSRAISGAFLLAPDPMGATGMSAVTVIERYRSFEHEMGTTFAFFGLMHAIVTPQHLAAIAALGDDRVHVFTGRVDPGLTDKGYISPGAGGIGERSNGREMGK